ncbi:Major facilitator superfamily domain, general substrate transporter [Akanthomyces lecanii RCEF 1005]|uniref:Major facilitator superfamily domain, general substrate transporter n=1 Tax=Akanthomyces lecanii RCEF 1005 TaxID=1081108 RepID=A0A168GCH1_CORDF|nr:Major facilitator superfamily domain, general substrate transporter [Akanthomyces lecanii RCEF 1005]
MVSSLREKRGSLAASQIEPVSHEPPVADVEKAAAGQITQTALGGTSSDTGNEIDSSGRLERWNGSRNNTARFLVVNLALFIMGMNDACIGALLPYIEPYYNVNYTQVSTLFAVPFVGYVAAALSNNWIHYKFGQRGVAFIGPICRVIGYLPMALHPPFPVLPVALLVAGYGNGIEDSGYNAWVGNMHQANELLGLVHGAYGLGATISPLIASAMVTKGHLQWYTFYYVMIGMVCCEFVAGMIAFAPHDEASYRRKLAYDGEGKERITTRHVLKQPLTWVVAVFLLGYVGVEVSLGGWIPTFMIKVRHAEPFLAGLSVTMFWLGLTLGRVILGFVTGRIGEKLAITVYILLSVGLQLLYWLVPNFAASLVFIILLGFFLGPLFPAAIVTATKLLPPEYHVSAIGFAGGFGGGGAAIIPFGVGAIAQSKGVAVLQPIVLAFLIFDLVGWLIMPGGFKRGGLERARQEKTPVGGDFVKAGKWVAAKARRD